MLGNKKYEDILKVARDLFWKHGFRRISVEEICVKAKVSKMTFYKFFPNKLELARCVFDAEANKGVLKFRSLINEDLSPAEKIHRMLMMKHEGTMEVSREFLSDFYNNPELGLRDYIEETSKRLWTEMVEDFRKGQMSGIFRDDIKPELILYMSQKMMELINDPSLLKLYSDPQELIMQLSNFFMYGISSRN